MKDQFCWEEKCNYIGKTLKPISIVGALGRDRTLNQLQGTKEYCQAEITEMMLHLIHKHLA